MTFKSALKKGDNQSLIINMNLVCQIVEFASILQIQSIELRRKILRIPLGLDFNKHELEEEKEQIHVVCLKDNNLIGVLLLVKQANGTLKMRQVAVDDNYQGQGIGHQMVMFSEKWALKNKFRTMVLNARKTAVPFYLSMDYLIEGIEFEEVGIPHFKMTKELI